MSSLDKKEQQEHGPDIWRSLNELEQKPEFVRMLQDEFPEQQEQLVDPLSRRRFMQLMGASMAFAGVATGCRWEEDKVVPLGRRPEDYVPGEPVHFATMMELGGSAQSLLVRSVDGRPIKIEGNPDHPASRGSTTKLAQASILGLYDPDRSTAVAAREGDKPVGKSWGDFEAWVKSHFGPLKDNGGGVAVLAEASTSPTVDRLRREFLAAFPQAKWYEYEKAAHDMVKYTSTHVSPWEMIPANNKSFARISVLETFGDYLEAALRVD